MSNVVELLKSKVKTSKDELEKALIKVKLFFLALRFSDFEP